MLKVPEMSMMICKGTDLEDFENVRIPKKNTGIQVLKSKVANSENTDNERTLRLLKNIRITNIDIFKTLRTRSTLRIIRNLGIVKTL